MDVQIQELLLKHEFSTIFELLDAIQNHEDDTLYNKESGEISGKQKRSSELERLMYPFPVTNATLQTVLKTLHEPYLLAAKEFLGVLPQEPKLDPLAP